MTSSSDVCSLTAIVYILKSDLYQDRLPALVESMKQSWQSTCESAAVVVRIPFVSISFPHCCC